MPYHFFSIRAINSSADEAILNAFLATNRVVAAHWQWIDQGLESRWTVRVEVATGPGPLPSALKADEGSAQKSKRAIDYRDALPPEQFDRYAALRRWRNGHANQVGIKPFHILTNEQMADIVRANVRSIEQLGKINGIGPSRLERFGAALMAEIAKFDVEEDPKAPPV